MDSVIEFMTQLPAWLLSHPWLSALALIVLMAAFTSIILLNPEGRQLRETLRRRR
jgi:hypothetical protein